MLKGLICSLLQLNPHQIKSIEIKNPIDLAYNTLEKNYNTLEKNYNSLESKYNTVVGNTDVLQKHVGDLLARIQALESK